MIKSLLVVLIAITIGYTSALVVFMPLSFAWTQVQSWAPEKSIPFILSAQRGTVWRGEAEVVHSLFKGIVGWQVTPVNALFGDSLIAWQMRSNEGFAQGSGRIAEGQLRLSSQLTLDLRALKPLLEKHRIALGGELVVSDLQVELRSLNGFPETASGSARWAGGPISYPQGRKRQSAVMPPLQATIVSRIDGIFLDVRDEATDHSVMHLQLTSGGSVQISIRKRLLDLANAPWSKNANPDDVIFKIEQKLASL